MKYFVPDIVTASDPRIASGLPPERFGGQPFGLPSDRWPDCKICNGQMSFLAQFQHHPERLNLDRDGRMLFVFMCDHNPGLCDTWDANAGANACLIVEPDDLLGQETSSKADTWTANPVFIAEWIKKDDGISETIAPDFFSESGFLKLSEQDWEMPTSSTKLGGTPCWIQSPDEGLKAPWQYIGQLDGSYSFISEPVPERAGFLKLRSRLPDWIHADKERWEGRSHFASAANFGDGGIAYLYVNLIGQAPEARMFWQCG